MSKNMAWSMETEKEAVNRGRYMQLYVIYSLNFTHIYLVKT